jgi:hypothetical protein
MNTAPDRPGHIAAGRPVGRPNAGFPDQHLPRWRLVAAKSREGECGGAPALSSYFDLKKKLMVWGSFGLAAGSGGRWIVRSAVMRPGR